MRRYALALVVVALPAQAQMYKCVDDHGRTRYADQPGAGCKALDIRSGPAPSGEAAPRKEDLATQDAEIKRRLQAGRHPAEPVAHRRGGAAQG